MTVPTGIVWSGPADDLSRIVPALLTDAGLAEALQKQRRVVIKPNLVEALAPPITTPAAIVEILVDYLCSCCPAAQIIIAEGTGSLAYDTMHCFTQLGYEALAARQPVTLIDLNRERCRHLRNPGCTRWPEMYLPELLFNSYLISVPVLKAHSLAGVTLTMKNMMGCAPPDRYQAGGWGKSSFHRNIQYAVFDLNRYRTPDFTLLDGSIGMARAHLWGPTCTPPVNRLAVAYDPVAIDAYGAGLLNRSWRDIGHIAMAHGCLGQAEPLDVRCMNPVPPR